MIHITSAVFHLNSLNIRNKSLDSFNQSKITLNNTWNYQDAKDDDDPIIRMLDKIQQPQYHETKVNGNLLLNAVIAVKNLTNYLTNEKPLKVVNNDKQQEPNNLYGNLKHLYHFRPALKFNNGNNENNQDNFNLNNKLGTITTYRLNVANDIQQDVKDVKAFPTGPEMQRLKEKNLDNFKVAHQTKFYAAAKNLNSNGWLGQLPPQFQLQTQQLQLLLQQQQAVQPTTSMAAAFLLPHEYHYLAAYRLFFNAERHTQFYLHTLETQNDFVTVATTKQATAAAASYQEQDIQKQQQDDSNKTHHHNDDDDDANNDDMQMQMVNLTNARIFNIITDTIDAVFGVNTRPVAAIQGIQIEEIELYNGLSLRQSRFNPFNPCRILIHGWLGGSKAGMYNALVPEYLKLQQGAYNVFTVDWGKGAVTDYITASYRVKPVGITLAKFIDFLHQESGIGFENIHVIGFSMGAHVAGIAGKYVQTGRLPVIYGLDPALPLFRYQNANERLDSKDAQYVEVIHTSVGSYGYDHPLGHVDFYINYGYNQPGCFFNECSHFRAFQVYAQSLIKEVLAGEECAAELWWQMIKYKQCSRRKSRTLRMGVEGLKNEEMVHRRGLFYVITNSQPPYQIS